jgi:Flp pilus assembly protein TadD
MHSFLPIFHRFGAAAPEPIRLQRGAARPGAWACAIAPLLLAGCAAAPESGYGPAFMRPASATARQAADAAAAGTPGSGAAAAASVDTAARYQALIRQMQGRGLWYASLAHVDALELRWGATDDSRLLRADALLQTEQPDAAEPLYHALLASPMAAAAYRGLARVAAARGSPQETVRMFEHARQRMPTDPALLSDLGYALLQAGQVERARVPLLQAAQLQADAPDAAPRIFSNLAVYLLLAGKPEEARALAEQRRMPPEVRQAVARQARALDRTATAGRDEPAWAETDALPEGRNAPAARPGAAGPVASVPDAAFAPETAHSLPAAPPPPSASTPVPEPAIPRGALS